MKKNSLSRTAVWVLVLYALFLLSGLALGDFPFLFWRYLFTYWLGWETYFGFAVAHMLGGAAALVVAWWLERKQVPGVDRYPALWAVLCLGIAVAALMLVAWNAAMLTGRPLGP